MTKQTAIKEIRPDQEAIDMLAWLNDPKFLVDRLKWLLEHPEQVTKEARR